MEIRNGFARSHMGTWFPMHRFEFYVKELEKDEYKVVGLCESVTFSFSKSYANKKDAQDDLDISMRWPQ